MSAAPAGGWRRAVLAAGVVLAVTFAAYLPSLDNGFTTWDDPAYVTENPAIRSLSLPAVARMFTAPFMGLYHPLTLLSLAVDWRAFGDDPAGYHAVNLALHLANTLLAFGVLRLLSGSLAAAFAGSLLFGVHPLHVESVAWIAERKDVLCAFFFLAALAAWLHRPRARRPAAWYLLALGLFAASLLAKPMGVTFPLVLYLCDYLGGRGGSRGAHLEKAPFAALALLSALVTARTAGLLGPAQAQLAVTADSLFAGAYSLVFLVAKGLLPLGLSALYPYPERAAGALPWPFLLSPLAVLLAGFAVLRSARFTRTVPFGALFTVVTLLPVLPVRIGPHVTADRYFYLPSLGLCYLAGVGFARLRDAGGGRRATRAAGAAALALVAVAWSALTWQRTLVWRDSLTLWEDAVARHPEPSLAHLNRGLARIGRGDHAGGVADITAYLAAFPLDAQAFKARGSSLAALGMADAALRDFDRAVALKPDYAEALNNRGALLAARGELERAVADFTRALAADPGYRAALANRARAREALGDREGAERDRARARATAPGP